MIVGPPLLKQPAEIWPWSVDFTPEMETDETIQSAVFTAKDVNGADATIELKQGSTVVVGKVAAQTLKGGVDGMKYLLQLVITTSLGHVWEAERLLKVAAISTPQP